MMSAVLLLAAVPVIPAGQEFTCTPARVWDGASGGVCRMHGARRPGTIRRGEDHPAYQHGKETLEAKVERSRRLTELRELEELSFALGLVTGPRWRGRKPKTICSLTRHQKH